MSTLRYIATYRYPGRDEQIARSSRGAESMYTTPGMAKAYAKPDGRVLVVDLATLPEWVPPEPKRKGKLSGG